MTDTTFRMSSLPVHPHPEMDAAQYRLRVDGMVLHADMFTVDDLLRLPRVTVDDDFTCLEGWSAGPLHWSGVRLATLLELVQPEAAAGWVQAAYKDFSLPLPMATAKTALLALSLNGEPLPVEHGAPVRLLVPGGECFTSVKWLNHLEVRMGPAPNTAESIARARIGL